MARTTARVKAATEVVEREVGIAAMSRKAAERATAESEVAERKAVAAWAAWEEAEEAAPAA